MSHKTIGKLEAIALLLSVFQVRCLICTATDYDSAAAIAREEFPTTATVEKALKSLGVAEPKHVTPVGPDLFDKWERPGRLQQWFPTYKLGTDDDGVPSKGLKRRLHTSPFMKAV